MSQSHLNDGVGRVRREIEIERICEITAASSLSASLSVNLRDRWLSGSTEGGKCGRDHDFRTILSDVRWTDSAGSDRDTQRVTTRLSPKPGARRFGAVLAASAIPSSRMSGGRSV